MPKSIAMKALIALLLAGVLTGCSTWQWHWPAWMRPATNKAEPAGTQPAMSPDSIAGILYFVGGVLALPRADRAAIYHKAQQQYKTHRAAADRLRLALLAALLPPPERDAKSARALLTNYSWRTTKPGYAGLVAVTLDVLDERRHAAGEVAEIQSALDKEHRDNARLQKQLEALKAIEKALGSRGARMENGG